MKLPLNIDHIGPGRYVGYADGVWTIVKSDRVWAARKRANDELLYARTLSEMGEKLTDYEGAHMPAAKPEGV